MTVYFGLPGALTSLNSVGRGFTVDLDLPGVLHEIAGSRGGRVIQRMGAEKRTFMFSKNHVSQDDLSVLEGYALGAYGPGPFVLIDSARRNLLTANQSSGTDVLDDTTGLSVTGTNYVLSSFATGGRTGPRVAKLVIPAGAGIGAGALHVGPSTVTNDLVPVRVGAIYRASSYVIKTAGTAYSTSMAVRWLDAVLGTVGSDVFSSAPVTPSASYQRIVTDAATAPAGSIYARPYVYNAAVATSGMTLAIDDLQFEEAAAASAWVLGTGVPRVSFIDKIAQSYLAQPYTDTAVTLIEV